jgi:hypothetical protein
MRSNIFAGSVITADSPFWKRPVDPVRPTPESIISRSCRWRTSVIAGEVRFLLGSCRLRATNIDTIDSELRLVAALRRAALGRGGPLPSIVVADALLDERRR